MLYEVDESNHPNWFNKGPWYNTDICSKFHGKLFEDFITDAIIDRYHIMCSIVAHDKNNLHMKIKKSVLEIGQYLKKKKQKH